MIRWWSAWVDRWSATEHGRALAWFRVALGALVFLDTASLLVAGVVDPLFLPLRDGGLATADRVQNPWLWLFGHTTNGTWVLVAGILVLSASVAVGLGGRVTAFLLLQAVLVLHAIPDDIGGGYDRLLTNGLFVLVLGRATATASLDCRLRTGRWTSEAPVPAWPRYLGIFQLLLVYTATGLEKRGPGWSYPYDAVFYSLQSWNYLRRGDLSWLPTVYRLTQLGTFVVWWWEVGASLLVPWWMAHLGWLGDRARRWADRLDLRWPFLSVGLVMHATLGVTLNVGLFSVLTPMFYLLWLDPPAPRVGVRSLPGGAPSAGG